MQNDGTTPGLHGMQYQAAAVMLLLIRGVKKKLSEFVIETEVQDAGKFDDIVFDEGNQNYTFIQLKHRESKFERKIEESELFKSVKGNFSLIKDVCSYKQIKESPRFHDKSIKNVFIFTNCALNLKSTFAPPMHLISDEKNVLKIDYHGNECYKFNNSTVSNILANNIHKILNDNKPKYKIRKDDINTLSELTLEEIEECLEKIIYAVNQPNQESLFKIVKEEMKNHFKFSSTDMVFKELHSRIINWLCTKKRNFPFEEDTIQSQITYDEAKQFLDRYIKPIVFNITPPIPSFVGRKNELDQMYQILNTKKEILISGVGGVGKTQLVKKFIQIYKNSNYFGRIIWINSENYSIQRSLKNLCKTIGINLLKLKKESIVSEHLIFEEKSMKEMIQEIIKYFQDVKVLFVFDILNTLRENNSKEYIDYFRNEIMKTSTELHVLIISRNEIYSDGLISSLNLNVLHKQESIELIRQQLDVNESDAKLLSELLGNFPLALQQAISYIIEQNNIKMLFGTSYSIQNYIYDFNDNKQTKNLLEFKREDDYTTDVSQTTFNVWRKTLDAIKNDKHGPTAVKIIQIMAHLDAETITASEFSSIFDQTDKEIGGAFLLLEKYSLIMREEKTSHIFQINKMIQKVIQIQMTENTEEERFIVLKLAMQIAMNEMKYHNITESLHFQSVSDHILENKNFIKKYARTELRYFITRYAAMKNNFEAVKCFLENGANLNSDCTCSFCKNTLLHISAYNGSKEIIEQLLAKGFDKKAINDNGEMPIHSAAIKGHIDIIDLFIQDGVDLNIKADNGCTVLHLAAQNGHLDLVKHLREKGMDFYSNDKEGRIAMHYAALNGHISIIDFFVQHGVDLNRKAINGSTVLHLAAQNGHLDLVKHLHEKGMDFYSNDKEGRIAMHYAALNGHISIVDFYIENGIDLNTKSNNGCTILHLAAQNGNLDLVKHLLDMGMNFYLRDEDGRIATHYAALNGHISIIDFFVQYGVDLNIQDSEGQTILHIAAFYGHLNLVTYLVDSNIDKNVKDNKNKLAFDIALEKKYEDIRNILSSKK